MVHNRYFRSWQMRPHKQIVHISPKTKRQTFMAVIHWKQANSMLPSPIELRSFNPSFWRGTLRSKPRRFARIRECVACTRTGSLHWESGPYGFCEWRRLLAFLAHSVQRCSCSCLSGDFRAPSLRYRYRWVVLGLPPPPPPVVCRCVPHAARGIAVLACVSHRHCVFDRVLSSSF